MTKIHSVLLPNLLQTFKMASQMERFAVSDTIPAMCLSLLFEECTLKE